MANPAKDVKIISFKSRDDKEFSKPDHDPHGENQNLIAHSSVTCDNCGMTGLVPEDVLVEADGQIDGVEYDLVHEACMGYLYERDE